MGCAQGRPTMSSPPQGLEKMKMANGYSKGEYARARRSTGDRTIHKAYSRPLRPEPMRDEIGSNDGNNGRASVGSRDGASRGSRERRLIVTELEKGSNGEDASNDSKRSSSLGKAGEEELVDGWPKWLTDNIPPDVLKGLIPRSADSYEKIDKIGQGTYSNVYKARDKETGKVVALKKVRFDTSEPESVKFMAREIMILQKLDNPNIIKLEGLATSRMQFSLYLVFEYMHSDLASVICRPEERLTEPQIKCYMHQLLSGLNHCHEKGILHRDIKGSNLLLDKRGMLKIADFGLANHFNPQKKRPLTSRVVTLWYRAPELLLGCTDYGVGIDLWSAGCLMAEMFAGRPILPGRTEVEQLHKIFRLCGTPQEEFWKRLKLSTTFRPPYKYEPSIQKAFRSFPSSSFDLLNSLLALDPALRGSAESALQNKFFYTTPLACDLSGLPVVYKEEDEPIPRNERRKSKSRKYRSQSHKERRKKDVVLEESNGDATADPNKELQRNFDQQTSSAAQSQDPGSSTSSSSGTNLIRRTESPPRLTSPTMLNARVAIRTDAHPNASKNIKNRPPLPNARRSTATRYSGDKDRDKYRFSQVQRSASTRDFLTHDQQKKLVKLHAFDD